MNGLKVGGNHKELIETLSEDILQTFKEIHLIDKYDIYQYLMDYWTSTMQDDVVMIVLDGWIANSDLVPAGLVIARYFKAEQGAIDQLYSDKDTLTAQKEEMEEEQGGEEGILEDLKSDKGKISKGEVQKRIKEIKDDPDFADELVVLQAYLSLLDQETDTGRKIKQAQKVLNAKVTAKYPALSEEEVKRLVVEDKWLAFLREEIDSEVEKTSHKLTQRVKELAERYSCPLPELEKETETLGARVEEHLNKMGFRWN